MNASIFHAEIVVDSAKISAETKSYKPIPVIAAFTDESGQDCLKASIEANYKQIKQEIIYLVNEEVTRISALAKS